MATARHPLLSRPGTIKGLSASQAQRLRRAGVTNLAELLAHREKDATRAQALARWQVAARFMALPAVSANLADALVTAGIDTLAELATARQTLDAVLRDLRPKKASTPNASTLRHAAQRAREKGTVVVRIRNKSRKAIARASIRVGGVDATTDNTGWAVVDGVSPGTYRIDVRPPGVFIGFGMPVMVAAGQIAGPLRTSLPKRKGAFATKAQRQSKGAIVITRPDNPPRLRTLPLTKVPNGSFLSVLDPLADGRIPIVNLDKVREGLDVYVERAVVAKSSLPRGVTKGEILQLTRGKLRRSPLTAAEITRVWTRRPVDQEP